MTQKIPFTFVCTNFFYSRTSESVCVTPHLILGPKVNEWTISRAVPRYAIFGLRRIRIRDRMKIRIYLLFRIRRAKLLLGFICFYDPISESGCVASRLVMDPKVNEWTISLVVSKFEMFDLRRIRICDLRKIRIYRFSRDHRAKLMWFICLRSASPVFVVFDVTFDALFVAFLKQVAVIATGRHQQLKMEDFYFNFAGIGFSTVLENNWTTLRPNNNANFYFFY